LANYCHECGTANAHTVTPVPTAKVAIKSPVKVKRKASEYSKKYGKAFKMVAPKHKLKSGSWKKNGFKSAQKAAHKKAKTMR
tara:strand:+ start:278 stop:523 length:246 start_codon:yes stop_codon:yes gene_type:complete